MSVGKIQKDALIREYGNASVTISAGTIGTYGNMTIKDIAIAGYTPVMAAITQIQHPSNYIPVSAIIESKLYFIFYRVSSNAINVPANDVTVNVLYEKTG